MKTLLIFILLFSNTIFAQEFDSTRIGANKALVVKSNKVLTFSIPQNSNEIISTYLYDGKQWLNITQDTIPTINLHNSRCTFSNFSDHLFVTGQYHLWEFDGKAWIKHAIYDSLYHRRRFEGIVELSDSSLLITTSTHFTSGQFGNTTNIDKIYSEILRFKNGIFTTVKSSGLKPGNGSTTYQRLKIHKDSTYSLITTDESENRNTLEIVKYNTQGNIIRKDIIPNLSQFGFDMEQVEFNDYLYDSKGSLWLLTKSYDGVEYDVNGKPIPVPIFVGLVEITSSKIINLYNENIGIQKNSSNSYSFSLDESDNIWFYYNYRKPVSPSIYMLHSNRDKISEYSFETILKFGRIYSGGNTSFQFIGTDYSLLVFNSFTNSLFIAGGGLPMLQFFPEKVKTFVWDKKIAPVELYPNPVFNDKNVIIESTSLGNNSQVTVVIRDISSVVVLEEKINVLDNQITFNINGLLRGSYYVSVLKNNKLNLQTKFIKE